MDEQDEIFYWLSVADIQTVAIQEINRKLTQDEIETIKDLITEKMNWYEAILNSIHEIT